MAEHFYPYEFTRRPFDLLFLYLFVDSSYLVKIQFASQHHHIGKLGIELQCLDVRDIQLGREMHLHTLLSAISHHSNVAGYDGRDVSLNSCINNLVHQGDVLTVNNSVHRQVTLHPMFLTGSGNLSQVVDGEVVGRVRTHVQLLHSEIHRCSPRFQRSSQ